MMTKPSLVFWAIGLFGLIWNAFGCYNFILQMDPEALAESPAAYQVVIASRSGWTTAAFLIAVFGGALTTGHALWAVAAVPGGWSVVISSAMSLAVAVGLVWYTHRKSGLDLLR